MSDTRAKKSRRPVPVKIVLSSAGILIIVFSIITIIGFFGEGGTVGENLSQLFQQILGKAAWIGPFITAAIGFLLIAYQPGRPTETKVERTSEKSHKPGGADIVSRGTGFKDYFTGPEPVDNNVVNQPNPELDEVGKNFKSYFGSKRESRRDAQLVSKGDGFSDYFASGEFSAAASAEVDLDYPEFEELPSVEPLEHENTFRAIVGQVLSDRQANKENKANLSGEGNQPLFQVVPGGKAEDPAAEQFKLEVVTKPARSETAPVSTPMAQEKPEYEEPKEVFLPPVILLDPPMPSVQHLDNTARENATRLEEVLNSFGVKIKVTDISQGPAITRYEIQPAPGIKISRIVGLADDMALALAAQDVRIEAPIPGKSAVGIEVPNKKVSMVRFREVMESEEFTQDSKLKVALGKDIAGKSVVADLSRMPHLLVAGATGSGKSVCMNTIITSILYAAKPNEVKFLLIDPKMVELAKYNGIPHLIAPVVTDPKKAAVALRWVVNEMETRYELFAAAGVRDITRYNEVNADQTPLPFVVVLIDELADLMMVSPGDVEEAICRLAQMARAAGIHLVVATQRPSVDVITGIIKANIPSRIAFAVSSQIDSRTILDGNGAEKLLGKGDMLYYPLGMAKPLRVQGCFLSDQEVERVVQHWKKQAKPEYVSTYIDENVAAADEDMAEDELFYEAARLFITSGMASVSLLQRRLRVGYTRAARLMDLLEQKGVVGGFEGSKPRQVMMSLSEFEELFGDN